MCLAASSLPASWVSAAGHWGAAWAVQSTESRAAGVEAPLLTDVSPYLVFTSVATQVCSEQAWVGVPPTLPSANC